MSRLQPFNLSQPFNLCQLHILLDNCLWKKAYRYLLSFAFSSLILDNMSCSFFYAFLESSGSKTRGSFAYSSYNMSCSLLHYAIGNIGRNKSSIVAWVVKSRPCSSQFNIVLTQYTADGTTTSNNVKALQCDSVSSLVWHVKMQIKIHLLESRVSPTWR